MSDLTVVILVIKVYNKNTMTATYAGGRKMDVNLVMLKNDGSQKTFPLPSSVTVIGRRKNCDLRIPLMSVSKKHCQVHSDGGKLKVRDLGSRNGTQLNGQRVEEADIKAGDHLQVGPLKFVFQVDGVPEKIEPPAPGQKTAAAPEAKAGPAEEMISEEMDDELFGSFDDLDELDGLDDLESLD